ncbi:MAG: ABC transporter permease [Succinivibrionaceae bacterium]|nr:ABC transporter permease [Succinivibrionaceae bacterium]
MISSYAIAYLTMVRREVLRFSRVWFRTLLPPMVNTALYFIIFGSLMGGRIGSMASLNYTDFMMPGLVMMSVVICSYTNVASSMYSARFQKYIEEVLVAPVPMWLIVLGFVTGGVIRGVLVGALVLLVAVNFTSIGVFSPFHALLMPLLASVLFSLAGFINAVYAKSFDDISVIPTLLLTPLIYLGGVFYTLDLLPSFWAGLSRFNPLLYVISTFRYGFSGVEDAPVGLSYLVVFGVMLMFFLWAVALLRRGRGLIG